MLGAEEMKSLLKLWPVAWTCVAVALGFGSFAGGDASIVSGWLFLVWTIPFGAIWWFYLYDIVRQWVPDNVAQAGGTVLVIVAAFVFWFVVVPRIKVAFERSVGKNPPGSN